jgi:dTDP-glucose 4,6-dehydratase
VALWGNYFEIPRSLVFIATPIFLLLSGGMRSLRRYLLSRSAPGGNSKRALIYGAGQMAELLVPQLLSDIRVGYTPVGLLDDDPQKSNRWISGVKMMGSFDRLPQAVKTTRAKVLIVAIPRATAELLETVYASTKQLGLEAVIMPSLADVLSTKEAGVSLRKLGIEDLVGRRAIQISTSRIRGELSDKTVLVTGAGGSIGIEICRQVAAFAPKNLVFVDRDETGLQSAQLAIENSGLLDTPNAVLADIRDAEAIHSVFEKWKPDVVFHAAALKHLPVLERHPEEAWKTNVVGTLNLLEAASRVGVRTFINISTDKAADPTSVLGQSKKLAEQLTAWFGGQAQGKFVSVRFGNVLGSRGSLVPIVAHLIESGGPVSLTHPDATRYFMTISEACQLVLQAGVSQDANAVFVLDMGEPVRILDVIERMIEMSGKEIPILHTGLRPGEKLHEVLHSHGDLLQPTDHPLISKVSVEPIDPKNLGNYAADLTVS